MAVALRGVLVETEDEVKSAVVFGRQVRCSRGCTRVSHQWLSCSRTANRTRRSADLDIRLHPPFDNGRLGGGVRNHLDRTPVRLGGGQSRTAVDPHEGAPTGSGCSASGWTSPITVLESRWPDLIHGGTSGQAAVRSASATGCSSGCSGMKHAEVRKAQARNDPHPSSET